MKQIDQFVVLKCQEQAQLDWHKYTNYYYYHLWGKKIKAFWQTSSGQYSTSKLLTLKSKNGSFSKAQLSINTMCKLDWVVYYLKGRFTEHILFLII